jgi:general secretion pathway protein I
MTRRPCQRRGLSLLEVLVALTIFLFAIVAIGRLIVIGTDQALEVQYQSEAMQIAQSRIVEVTIGAIALEPQSDVPVEDSPWFWSLDCDANDNVANLWNVTVHVSRKRPDGSTGEYCTLSQMILDPSQRGSSFDNPAANSSSSSTSGSSSTPSTNSTTSGSGTGSTSSTGK